MNKRPPSRNSLLLTLAACAALFPVSGNGSLVFTEDFDSYAPGVLIEGDRESGATWLARTGENTNDDNLNVTTRVLDDAGNVFGTGKENRFLQITRSKGAPREVTQIVSTNSASSASFGKSGQIAFDFSVPEGDPLNRTGVLLRIGTTTGNSGTAFALYIRGDGLYSAEGTNFAPGELLAAVVTNRKHSIVIVFNNTNAAIPYGANSGQTVATGSFDVWLDGVPIGRSLAKAGPLALGTPLTLINFVTPATGHGTLWVDNIVVQDVIAVGG